MCVRNRGGAPLESINDFDFPINNRTKLRTNERTNLRTDETANCWGARVRFPRPAALAAARCPPKPKDDGGIDDVKEAGKLAGGKPCRGGECKLYEMVDTLIDSLSSGTFFFRPHRADALWSFCQIHGEKSGCSC